MYPHEAQHSLDHIHRLQDRTRDELARHIFALPQVLLMGLGLFVIYAATDLPSPWDDISTAPGLTLFIGAVIMQHRRMCRASVRPRRRLMPTGLEFLFYLGWGLSPTAIFLASNSVAEALDLAAPGTLAATVATLTFVATTPLARRIVKAVMRQENGRL